MTTTLTREPQMLALLDLDTSTPSLAEHGLGQMRRPDMVERGRCFWLGPDAAVSCWMTADFEVLADKLARWGWMARTGATPSRSGLIVEPYAECVPRGPLQRNGHLYSLWAYAAEAVLAN